MSAPLGALESMEAAVQHPAGVRSTPSLSVELPARLDSPRRARRALLALDGAVEHALMAKARLLLSELVGHSLRRGGPSSVRVEVTVSPEVFRVQLIELGAPGTAGGRPGRWAHSGLGLVLLRRMASRWEINADGSWFELDRARAAD